jgi:hypothetical protein
LIKNYDQGNKSESGLRIVFILCIAGGVSVFSENRRQDSGERAIEALRLLLIMEISFVVSGIAVMENQRAGLKLTVRLGQQHLFMVIAIFGIIALAAVVMFSNRLATVPNQNIGISQSTGLSSNPISAPDGTWSIDGNGYPATLTIHVDTAGNLVNSTYTEYGQSVTLVGFWDFSAGKLTFIRPLGDSPDAYQIFTGYLFVRGSPIIAGTFEAFRGTGATAQRTVYGWYATQ